MTAPVEFSRLPALADERREAAGPRRRSLLIGSAAMAASTVVQTMLGDTAKAARAPRDLLMINSLGALFDRAVPPAPGQSREDYMLAMYTRVTAKSLEDARHAGLDAVNITLGYIDGAVDPFEFTMREFGRWNMILERFPERLIPVRNAADILRAKKERKIGVIAGFQNGVAIGNDASRVDLFADLGLRVFQLTYNISNQLGHGCLAPPQRGLSPLGRQVIERLNARRLMVDLSHSGRQTCMDALAASTAPITISHTGCRALADLPRNKADDELRGVADKGGYVGIYFTSFLRAEGVVRSDDVIAHIEHAIDICGEDHVGIGTDGLLSPPVDTPEQRRLRAESFAARKKSGIASPGEENHRPSHAVDLNDTDQLRKVAGLLRRRGHSQARIEKIMGLNFLRVARDIWG